MAIQEAYSSASATTTKKPESFLDPIETAARRMHDLLSRITAIAEQLDGGQPRDPERQGDQPMPAGCLHQAAEYGRQINLLINAANEQLERIQRNLP